MFEAHNIKLFWSFFVLSVGRTRSKGEGDGSGVKLVWLLDRDAENDGMDSEMVTYSAGNRDISDTESEVQINGLLPNSSYTLRTVSKPLYIHIAGTFCLCDLSDIETP